MCFNARFRLEVALKRAKRSNDDKEVRHWENSLKQYDKLFQVSGFAHPKVVIYTNNNPYKPQMSNWGLIPDWAKNAKSIWNKTINARGESIFEKPAFIKSAEEQRCLIPAEGFYEYHHIRGKKYPFYISHKEGKPLIFAGLWNEWKNPENNKVINTFSVVTTKANRLMTKIHNNPKLSGDSRMPVILTDELANDWLKPLTKNELQDLLQPLADNELIAHSVRKLSGKDSPGNVYEASKEYIYNELEFGENNQLTFFK